MSKLWMASSLPDVRRLAVRRVIGGEPPAEVADSLAVSLRSVQRWTRAFGGGGSAAPRTLRRRGRPPKLDASQAQQLLDWVGQSPLKFGFITQRWTAPRLASIVLDRFGIAMNHRYLNAWLARRGVTPQIPPRRAIERDEANIARWVRYEWPRIKKKRVTCTQPLVLQTKPASSWRR